MRGDGGKLNVYNSVMRINPLHYSLLAILILCGVGIFSYEIGVVHGQHESGFAAVGILERSQVLRPLLAVVTNLGGGNDKYVGSTDADRINGGAGSDYLRSSLGNDRVDGGPGTDLIRGNPGVDILEGGADADFIRGGDQSDRRIDGGEGDDFLMGNNGNDHMLGGNGRDRILGGGDNDTIIGGMGSDFLTGETGVNTYQFNSLSDIDGDVIEFASGDKLHFALSQTLYFTGNTVFSSKPGEVLITTGTLMTTLSVDSDGDAIGETVLTFIGSPTIGAHNVIGNVIFTNPDAVVTPDDGASGQLAAATLAIVKRFGSGHDRYVATAQNDTIYGGSGEDDLRGGAGNDRLYGGKHGDFLLGNGGDDELYGQEEVDFLLGDSGNDTLSGGDSHDFLIGGGGNDTLTAGEGSDRLVGESGDDVLIGSIGGDFMSGGDGADTFLFQSAANSVNHFIVDFEQGIDSIVLSYPTPLTFIGNQPFSNTAGEVRYEMNARTTFLAVDTNGDGIADAHIIIGTSLSLSESDVRLTNQ